MIESTNLIDILNNMLRDENPTVISSALASLTDIWERSETVKLTIDYSNASKVVQILPDCSEYVCIVFIGGQYILTNTDGDRYIYSRL